MTSLKKGIWQISDASIGLDVGLFCFALLCFALLCFALILVPLVEEKLMASFRGRHFEPEVILWSVHWYCK